MTTQITYSSIVYNDSLAIDLHNSAEFSEFIGDYNAYVEWNNFYERIDYLEEICKYSNIEPEE